MLVFIKMLHLMWPTGKLCRLVFVDYCIYDMDYACYRRVGMAEFPGRRQENGDSSWESDGSDSDESDSSTMVDSTYRQSERNRQRQLERQHLNSSILLTNNPSAARPASRTIRRSEVRQELSNNESNTAIDRSTPLLTPLSRPRVEANRIDVNNRPSPLASNSNAGTRQGGNTASNSQRIANSVLRASIGEDTAGVTSTGVGSTSRAGVLVSSPATSTVTGNSRETVNVSVNTSTANLAPLSPSGSSAGTTDVSGADQQVIASEPQDNLLSSTPSSTAPDSGAILPRASTAFQTALNQLPPISGSNGSTSTEPSVSM